MHPKFTCGYSRRGNTNKGVCAAYKYKIKIENGTEIPALTSYYFCFDLKNYLRS